MARPHLRLIRGGKAAPPRQPTCVHCGRVIPRGEGIDAGSGPGHFDCRARARRAALAAIESDLAFFKMLGPVTRAIPSVRERLLDAMAEPDEPSSSALLDVMEHAVERASDVDEARRALARSLIRAWRARIGALGQKAL